MTVIIYSKPNCVACTYTKRFLREKSISFHEVDIMSDPLLATYLRESGRLEMPYVVTDNGAWSGYRRDKLKELLQ